MKRNTLIALLAVAITSIGLTACGGGDKAKIEVDDKLLSDGKEIEIETPGGDAHIDVPAVDGK